MGTAVITISYDSSRLTGLFIRSGDPLSSIWDRLKARVIESKAATSFTEDTIELPWPNVLNIIREFGTRQIQQSLNFRFAPQGIAAQKILQFVGEVRRTRLARETVTSTLSGEQIIARLKDAGFVRRELKPFQLRDVERLLCLSNGANFSVPGAGKTTVTFALHLLTRQPEQHFFVVGPKSSFPAWRGVVDECMTPEAPDNNAEQFTVLDGRQDDVDRLLRSGATRFVMSYDLMIRQQALISSYLSRQPVHLVIDEAHRMKAGGASQRGAFLLTIANLPIRRDILTGTPMPQGPSDLASQLAFLWPGHGLDLQIDRGENPRNVLGNLFVRTTKQELGLRPPTRHFCQIDMSPGQMALYGVVRDESLRQLTLALKHAGQPIDFLRARRSVMRLLQLSINPILALKGIASSFTGIKSGIVDQVLNEGPSLKMQAVAGHARRLAESGQKTVIWTIFTDTLNELERMLADLNPITLYGAVPSGDFEDQSTREGRLRRFHIDPACMVLIANPAAAGEGISLHMVCHNAIYADRSYVSTHYLQSIDRIHRLGLPSDVDTHIYIYQTRAPAGLGSIDFSVSRRLAAKLRGLQQLLEDPDLHQIALDEENADDPVDYDVELQDLIDLVGELEGQGSSENEEDV